MEDLKAKLSSRTACFYFENPSYLGCIEDKAQGVSDLVHGSGGLSLVGVDPVSLGVLAPPSNYGADIVCGDIQPLGMHMQYGGGLAGFIATRDEEKYVMEYPSRLFGITPTAVEGEWGFGDVAYDRTSFSKREKGKEFVGTAAALWGITAGVCLALLGPQGIGELGRTILQKGQYARKKLSQVKGVAIRFAGAAHFKEFVVDFSRTGRTVGQINDRLRERGVFGGGDLGGDFPDLSGCALYCVTEMHSREDIDALVRSLREIIEG
jgi:glycine dehydrogenase subunit 1